MNPLKIIDENPEYLFVQTMQAMRHRLGWSQERLANEASKFHRMHPTAITKLEWALDPAKFDKARGLRLDEAVAIAKALESEVGAMSTVHPSSSPKHEEFTFRFIPTGLDVDRNTGSDPDEALTVLPVDGQPSTAAVHRLLDLVGQGFELLDRALDHLPAADEDLRHDSSSPLPEGAATPGDDSVEREASAAPSTSPEGAARQAGEQR